jgi:hypothetical protein
LSHRVTARLIPNTSFGAGPPPRRYSDLTKRFSLFQSQPMPSDSVIRAAEVDRQNWLGLVSGSFRYSVGAIGPSPIRQLVRPTPRNGDRVVCARDYCATA